MFSYPFHVRDYLTKTRHLGLLEDLAYRRMLDLYYTNEHPLPSDAERIARLILMPENAREVLTVLGEFFTQTDDGWTNSRCEKEVDHYHQKVARAMAATEARWGSRSNPKSDSKRNPGSTQSAPRSRVAAAEAPLPEADSFLAFWSAYPRKDSKVAATKAWRRLNPSESDCAQIMAALAVSKSSEGWTREGGRFIPHAATWINGRRWLDSGVEQAPEDLLQPGVGGLL